MLTLPSLRLATRLPSLTRSPRAFSTSSRLSKALQLASEHFAPAQPATAGPLVVLHGLYGSKQNWRGLAKAMATQLKREVTTLVSPPRPSHGKRAELREERRLTEERAGCRI